MEGTLGILVCTSKHFDHVMNLARAALKAGVNLRIFFTGDGVTLTQHPDFPELCKLGRVKICDVSYQRLGYTGVAPGLDPKGHSNQMEHALIVAETDRYVVF